MARGPGKRPLRELHRLRVTHAPVRIGPLGAISLEADNRAYRSGRVVGCTGPCIVPSVEIGRGNPVGRCAKRFSVDIAILFKLKFCSNLKLFLCTYHSSNPFGNHDAEYIRSLNIARQMRILALQVRFKMVNKLFHAFVRPQKVGHLAFGSLKPSLGAMTDDLGPGVDSCVFPGLVYDHGNC